MITKKVFGGKNIEFDALIADGNVMVNATQMAKIFKREVAGFLKTDTTRNFVIAACRAENLPSENEFTPEGKIIKVVSSGRNNGTWMNRIAAIKFAAWLDADFEYWVYSTIEEILFGFSKEQDKSIRRAVVLTQKLNELEKKMDKTGEDFELYMKLDQQLKNERTVRAQNTKARFREIYRSLKPLNSLN